MKRRKFMALLRWSGGMTVLRASATAPNAGDRILRAGGPALRQLDDDTR
jgi:hypothetical protein